MPGTSYASIVMLVGFVALAIYVICKAYSRKYKD